MRKGVANLPCHGGLPRPGSVGSSGVTPFVFPANLNQLVRKMRAIQRVVSAAAITLLALPVTAQSESQMSEQMRNEIRQLIREEVRAAVKDALADAKGTKTSVAKKLAAKKQAFAKKASAAKKRTVALEKAKVAKGEWNSALKDALKVLKTDGGGLRVVNLDGAIDLGGGHAWMGEGEGVQVILDAIVGDDGDEGHETHKVFVVGDGEHAEWVEKGHEHAEKIIAKLHGDHGKWVAKVDDDDRKTIKIVRGDGGRFELPGGKGWVTFDKGGETGKAFHWVQGDDDDHKTFKVMSGDEGNVFFLRKGEHDDDHGEAEECTRHETFKFDGGEGHVIVRRSGDDNVDVDVKVIRSDDFHKAHGKGAVISLDDVTNMAHGKGMVIKLDDVTNECCSESEECCDEAGSEECCTESEEKVERKATIRLKKKSKKSILL